MKSNCFTCIHKRTIFGDCHISCSKPDPDMVGESTGVRGGWFNYPTNFDPTWMAKKCCNWEKK